MSRFCAHSLFTLLQLFCLTALTLQPAVAQTGPPPAASYRGSLEIPGLGQLELILKLSADSSGQWSATLDVPAQGASGLALREVVVSEQGEVSFVLDSPAGVASFSGQYDGEQHSITGTFRQAELDLPLTLSLDDRPARLAAAQGKLADLDSKLAQWMSDWRVPGCAVGVLLDGQVVLAKGYGLRNLDTRAAVTSDTLFPIGSATKAFTALLLAQQVAAGRLEWDKPVRDYLPDFRLADEHLTNHTTVRDMLTHRTGLPRHDALWYSTPFDRTEIVRRMRYLEASAELRSQWQYNNLMYMTAGQLAGVLAGSSWEEQIRARILGPLGMSAVAVTTPECLASPDHADGYWERPGAPAGEAGPVEFIPLSDFQAAAPAGSLCASVNDMLKWVEFQLGDGQWQGQEILRQELLTETHTMQMAISSPPSNPRSPLLGYGLGWFVSSYQGHYCVDHGGNIDGFSAMVRLFPHDKLGIVVLTNMAATPLTNIVAYGVADRLLDLEENDISSRMLQTLATQRAAAKSGAATAPAKPSGKQPGASPAHPLESYTGHYSHPAYGRAEILINADKHLTLRFNSFEAVLSHQHFETFEVTEGNPLLLGTQLLFNTDIAGRVASLSVVLEPAVEAIVFEHEAANPLDDPAFAAAAPGRYQVGEVIATVSLRDGKLFVQVPDQAEYELVPVAGHEFKLKGLDAYGLSFDYDAKSGVVSQVVFIQPGGRYAAQRL